MLTEGEEKEEEEEEDQIEQHVARKVESGSEQRSARL